MSNLIGLKPRDTYQWLLNTGAPGPLSATPMAITLGDGTPTGMSLTSTGLRLSGNVTIENTTDATRLNLVSAASGASAPELWFKGYRQNWLTGIDVANNGGGCDFVVVGLNNCLGANVADIVYVARNKTGDNSLADDSGYPSIGFCATATADIMFNFGTPPVPSIEYGDYTGRTVIGIRKSGDTPADAKMFLFYGPGGHISEPQVWMRGDYKWNKLPVLGDGVIEGQLTLPNQTAAGATSAMTRGLLDSRALVSRQPTAITIASKTTYEASAMSLILTPGWWEIGGNIMLNNAGSSTVPGGKLWLEFEGLPYAADSLASREFITLMSGESTTTAAVVETVTAPYSGTNATTYVSRAIASVGNPRFKILPSIIFVDYTVKINIGFSQQTSSATQTTLAAYSTIWAKLLKR